MTRECLAAIPDTLDLRPSVARELTALIKWRCKPGMISSGQWDRVHLERYVLLKAQDNRVVWHSHRARKADAERLLRRVSTGACATSSLTRAFRSRTLIMFPDQDHELGRDAITTCGERPHSGAGLPHAGRLMPPISPQPGGSSAQPRPAPPDHACLSAPHSVNPAEALAIAFG